MCQYFFYKLLIRIDCQQAIYDVATALGLDAKQLFLALYTALIGKDQGPRLGSFMRIIGKAKLEKHLLIIKQNVIVNRIQSMLLRITAGYSSLFSFQHFREKG